MSNDGGGIREQVLDCLLHEHQLPLCRGPVHVFGRKHLESGAVSWGDPFTDPVVQPRNRSAILASP